MRLLRLRGKLTEIYEKVGIDLIAYEAARNAMPKMQGALVVQAMIQAAIVMWCEDININYRGYSPTEVKKHATGKGNSGKAAMIKAANKAWHFPVQDDNEADAICILLLCQRDLGEAISKKDRRKDGGKRADNAKHNAAFPPP